MDPILLNIPIDGSRPLFPVPSLVIELALCLRSRPALVARSAETLSALGA